MLLCRQLFFIAAQIVAVPLAARLSASVPRGTGILLGDRHRSPRDYGFISDVDEILHSPS